MHVTNRELSNDSDPTLKSPVLPCKPSFSQHSSSIDHIMVTKTTVSASQPLRRRMNLLGATHTTHALRLNTTGSLTSSDSKGLSGISVSDPEDLHIDDNRASSPSDYGTGSDLSDHEQAGPPPENLGAPMPKDIPKRPHINTSHLPPYKDHARPSPMSPNTRAWYEFDLAVVVALVSPIGNWLTGGDHVKNLLLIIFLIFYLHQIIEGAHISIHHS